jgi:uncharacterized metal-binding protein YceD (DUF177 family)
MHVKVQEFLAQEVGYRRSFMISGERPDLDGLSLTSDLDGEITISRLDEGVLVTGYVQTELELVCDRCLRSFTRRTRVPLERVYRTKPVDDDLPIVAKEVDLVPLIWQELTVAQPIKQLCGKTDCASLDPNSSEPKTKASLRLGDRARITKG